MVEENNQLQDVNGDITLPCHWLFSSNKFYSSHKDYKHIYVLLAHTCKGKLQSAFGWLCDHSMILDTVSRHCLCYEHHCLGRHTSTFISPDATASTPASTLSYRRQREKKLCESLTHRPGQESHGWNIAPRQDYWTSITREPSGKINVSLL